MIKKILEAKNPILRATSVPIGKIDKKVTALVTDLIDTLSVQKEPEGVGLAAPQIGKNLRIFAMVLGKGIEVVINPKVLGVTKKKKTHKAKRGGKSVLEGCLSIPQYYGPLVRNPEIKIEYMKPTGELITRSFKGFDAQVVQHEIDHLDGILFIDRLLEEKMPLFKYENKEWEEIELI